jgi:type I restriction enzyme S subunit
MSKTLPAGWRECTVSELADVDPDVLPEATPADYTFSYVDISSVDAGRISPHLVKHHFRGAPSRARKKLRCGDVLFGTVRPNLLPFAHFRRYGQFVASTGFAVLRAKEGASDAGFLYQTLYAENVARQVESLVAGSNYPAITTTNVGRLKIVAPVDVNEQREIARILSRVDALIEKNEALMSKRKTFEKALRQTLLGLEDLSTLPSGWPLIHIGDEFSVDAGFTPSRANESNFDSDGTPWVKTLDLNEGLLVHTEERLSARAVTGARKALRPAGSVLVAMYGGWEQIGRTGLLNMSATTNQAICALGVASDEWDSWFVLFALQHLRPLWRLVAVSTRKDPNITKSDVEGFQIPKPPLAEQRRIATALRNARRLTDTTRAEADKLRLLKAGLMQDLLSGRVRVQMQVKMDTELAA